VTVEKELLHRHLRGTREHVLGIVDGLDDAAMRRQVLPTGWTCLSMLSHLTYDIEQFWFPAVMAAEPDLVAYFEGEPADPWRVDAQMKATAMVAAYQESTERSDAIIDALPLTAPPGWWPDALFGDFRLADLSEIIMHVVVETATHAGHLDAARELIDGRTWLVL
jgi:hypothetical protein